MPLRMPYARVTVGETAVFADENGDFEIEDDGPGPFTFEAELRVPYFRVFNEAGVETAKEAMTNAVKHSEADKITLFSEVKDGQASIRIRDKQRIR